MLPQDYYNPIDCFRSFLSVLKSSTFKFQEEKCVFRGVNFFPVINSEQKSQRRNTGITYFINQINMFSKWKQLGYCMRTYVGFWELKNCEAPALIGVKKSYPMCKTVAYQHGALIPKLLFSNYKTTWQEFQASPHPDVGIANSEINKAFLGKEGFPEYFIKVGPALRFKYLKNAGTDNTKDNKGILICLPLKTSSACEILELCYQAFQPYSFPVKIWVKPHPMMSFSTMEKRLSFPWPHHFELAEGSMEKWLAQSKVVIASDSNTMVESVYKGLRTIVIGKERDIDITPLDIIDNTSWKLVYDAMQLREVVSEFLREERKAGGLRDNNFIEFNMNLLDRIFEA